MELKDIDLLKELKPNWNGYGGLKIDDELIAKVKSIIHLLPKKVQVFPTGRGSIQLEKFTDENNLIEIEISLDECGIYECFTDKTITYVNEQVIDFEDIPAYFK